MRSSSDRQLERFASLEQELDDLYGDLGLPRPQFGELTVRRLKAAGQDAGRGRRAPARERPRADH